jgi:hypothetical protein
MIPGAIRGIRWHCSSNPKETTKKTSKGSGREIKKKKKNTGWGIRNIQMPRHLNPTILIE